MADTTNALLNDEELELLKMALTSYIESGDRGAGDGIDAIWRKIKDAPSMYRAYVETRNFLFEGYGTSAESAVDACYDGWVRHCYGYRQDMEIDVGQVSKEDIGAYEIQIDQGYRDGDDITQAPEGKELVVVSVTSTGSKAETMEILAVDRGSKDGLEEVDFWCECEEETASEFHDDEYDDVTGKRLSKHYWTCRQCKKVKQVG